MLAIQPYQNRRASLSEHSSGFAPIVCCQANTNKRSVSEHRQKRIAV
ncbi:hypothetical protein [Helicobacter pylori]|nr:hypothetical protein [Helicobacter pylori]